MRKASQNLKPWLWFLTALAIPLGCIIAWHFQNHYYPRNDSGNYLLTTLLTLKKIFGQAVETDLETFNRMYKPILHPYLLIPFWFLAGKKVLATIAVSYSFFFVLFFLFTYLLSRELMANASALIATLLVCTLGWVFGSAQIALAELPQMAAIAATLYYLIKSDYFRARRPSLCFGIALAASLCIRPIESGIALFFPVGLYLHRAAREKFISRKDLAFAGATTLVCVLTLFIPVVRKADFHFWGSAITMGILLAFFALVHQKWVGEKKKKPSLGFLWAFMPACALTTFWFVPESYRLVQWIDDGTFYSDIFHDAMSDRKSLLHYWWFTFDRVGGPSLLLVSIAALASRFFPRNKKVATKLARPSESLITSSAIAALVLILIESAISSNNDPRYFYSHFMLIIIALSAIALDQRRRFFWLRAAMPLGAVALSLCSWLANANLLPNRLSPPYQPFGEKSVQINAPVFSGAALWHHPDPMLTVIDAISSSVGDSPQKIGLIKVRGVDSFSDALGEEVLSLIADERELRLWIIDLGDDVPTDKDLLARFSGFSHVLLGPLRDHGEKSIPQRYLGGFMEDLWNAKNLDRVGLEWVKTISTPDITGTTHSLLLLKNKRQRG